MCLTCFLGFCTGPNQHTFLHSEKTGHHLFLRLFHHDSKPAEPQPLTTLGIGVEGGCQNTTSPGETTMTVFCSACNREFEATGAVFFSSHAHA